MAVPRDSIAMLYMVREGDCHYSINNLIKKTKASIGPSLFQCSQSEFVCHLSYRCPSVKISNCQLLSASSSLLDLFYLRDTFFGVRSNTAEAYSNWGLTRVLYVDSLTFEFLLLTFLRTYPRVRFAFPTTRSTWELHERLLETSTPRYLAQVIVSKTLP